MTVIWQAVSIVLWHISNNATDMCIYPSHVKEIKYICYPMVFLNYLISITNMLNNNISSSIS